MKTNSSWVGFWGRKDRHEAWGDVAVAAFKQRAQMVQAGVQQWHPMFDAEIRRLERFAAWAALRSYKYFPKPDCALCINRLFKAL